MGRHGGLGMREPGSAPVNVLAPWTLSASDSAAYERFRPEYPDALFRYLADLVERRERAWDCGAGPGQAARGLRAYFDRTVATDRCAQQLRAGGAPVSIDRIACDSRRAALRSRCVDLIAIGQALHWFATEDFFDEVRRVARDGAVLAAWTYGLLRIAPAIDRELDRFHDQLIRDYWPAERMHVDRRYGSIRLPFTEIATPSFVMTAQWPLDHVVGYVRTWSAVRRARAASGRDPVTPLAHALAERWGAPEEPRDIQWPFTVRAAWIG